MANDFASLCKTLGHLTSVNGDPTTVNFLSANPRIVPGPSDILLGMEDRHGMIGRLCKVMQYFNGSSRLNRRGNNRIIEQLTVDDLRAGESKNDSPGRITRIASAFNL